MLDIDNVCKNYGNQTAVNGLSFHVQKGEFFGLLGPNGAGKTTSIHMISGIMRPDEGQILINGESLYGSGHQLKHHMGVVPQEIALYNDLTAIENLKFWGSLYGMSGKKLDFRANELTDWVGLTDRRHDRISAYSGGMKRRINIAVALMHNPDLLLMDEPTVGIDPQSRNHIYDMLQQLHRDGKTIIYTTHYMAEAEDMCDRIGIIDNGKLIGLGTLSELKRQHSPTESFHIQLGQPVVEQVLPDRFQAAWSEDKNAVTIQSTHPQSDLIEVIRILDEQNISVDNIDLQRLNLETIFLNLTGRTLRD